METKANKRKDDETMAQELMLYLNGSHNKRNFAKAIMKDHRYLQAEFMELMLQCIKEYQKAFEDSRYDPRNKQAVLVADRIAKELEL